MSLIAELKRRRVFRVAGAYLVGAWIVLQVADTLFPALHLPPWTVTLVAAAVVLGFPIALVLGWAFDITPGGIERTPTDRSQLGFPLRAAAVGTVVVAVGVASLIIVKRNAVASKLDENAVVVLPFRVAGDASIMAMREGMVDLLAAKLTGEGGPRAIDSRTTMSAWRRKIDNERDDMPLSDAVQLARSLGAGQVLLGEVIGTPGNIVVNATLYSAIDGTAKEKATDEAPPDSMLQSVDRLVAKLLSQQAGQGHRAEALLSESLTAVQAYLEGQRLFRRGSHADAALRFKSALDEDSTFALAGLGLALARSWSGHGPEYQRGRAIAWTHRDRLPQPDREFVIAWIGEKYPRPTPPRDQLAAWQRIVTSAPDRVEAWYALGDLYYHFGAVMDIDEPDDKALDAWQRALRLDSAYVPALSHQIPLYAERGDTAHVREISDLLFKRIQPDRRTLNPIAWPAALALNDEDWLKDLRAAADSMTSNDARNAQIDVVLSGLPSGDVPRLIEVSIERATDPGATMAGILTGVTQLANMGQPKAALAMLQRAAPIVGAAGVQDMTLAFSEDYVDLEATGMSAHEQAPAHGPDAQRLCIRGGTAAKRGDREAAVKALNALRAAVAANPETEQRFNICVLAIDASLKVSTKAPDARAAVLAIDSALMNGVVSANWREHFTLHSTGLHLALGDLEGALAASKRVQRDQGYARAPLLLERARIASRLGKRDEAIQSYELYLKMRANSEPGRASEITDQARRELAALVGERSR